MDKIIVIIDVETWGNELMPAAFKVRMQLDVGKKTGRKQSNNWSRAAHRESVAWNKKDGRAGSCMRMPNSRRLDVCNCACFACTWSTRRTGMRTSMHLACKMNKLRWLRGCTVCAARFSVYMFGHAVFYWARCWANKLSNVLLAYHCHRYNFYACAAHLAICKCIHFGPGQFDCLLQHTTGHIRLILIYFGKLHRVNRKIFVCCSNANRLMFEFH